MNADFDIAVVGSGFGGSLMAMIARRLGRSVILLERGKHPRFVIGESSTPLANLLLEELARRYELPRLLPLTKWGTWQKAYPHLGCGLKRGFTFYHHQFGQPFLADPERRDQLLVAASPRDEIADTHWYRPDFDHFLVREAQSLGVEYLDQAKLGGASIGSDSVQVEGEHAGGRFAIRARFVVDASGPRGFLPRALRLPEASFENFPRTQALYAHFPFVHTPRLSFRCGAVVGPRWALLPSAAGFVDPLLSTGFPLTLLGVGRLAEILATDWNSAEVEARLSQYAQCTLQELDAAARLVGA